MVEYSHTGRTTLSRGDPYLETPAFALVNLRLGLELPDYAATLTLWGRNLFGENYRMSGFDAVGQAGRVVATPLEPRTWGVSLRKRF